MSRSSDEAVAQVLEALTVGIIVFGAVVIAVHTTSPTGAGEAQRAYEDKEGQVRDAVSVGKELCCPKDPSATSVLEDRAMQAWAGHPGLLHETVDPLLAEPRTTDFAVKASWAPPAGNALHTLDLYRTAASDGKSAGDQQLADPADQGPMYVVPRLDKVSKDASADILAVPVDNVWPYTRDLHGAHEDMIRTEITYQRTAPGEDELATASLTGYSEVTGSGRPAVELSFQEPDWQQLESDVSLGLIDLDLSEDLPRNFTQVLTSEDLASEKTLHNELNDDKFEDGEYPQHPFQIQANLTATPDEPDGTTHLPPGETRHVTDAYELTIHIPRNWTDVEIKTEDENTNKNNSWTDTQVQSLPSGGYRITSLLNKTIHANVTGDPDEPTYRRTLLNATETQAPFKFHARPPNDDTTTEIGFHEIQATLEPLRFPGHERATLTVEVANSLGRVHRTLTTHTPTTIPKTPWSDHHRNAPEAVNLSLGATLKNGGELTTVDQVTWTIPQRNWTSPSDDDTLTADEIDGETTWRFVKVLEDYTGEDPDKWTLDHDGQALHVTWDPDLTTLDVDTDCAQLEACAVAAEIHLDGRNLTPEPPWQPPRLVSLYDHADLQGYLDWHVRTHQAWGGAPLHHSKPDFALAHRYQVAHAGPAEHTYRFTLPPTLTPACEDEIQDRNQPRDTDRRNGRMHHDLGPREDGIPHLADDCEQDERAFTALAKMGDRWTTQAIGNHPYTSTANLSSQLVSQWQNGLAESRVTAQDRVPAGQDASVTVELDSLMNVLSDDVAANASVVYHVFDPYNAWETTPWQTGILWDPDNDYEADGDPITFVPDDEGEGEHRMRNCRETSNEDCDTEAKWDRFPPEVTVPVPFPEDTVPGTHLIVVEARWSASLETGDITETGRLVEPIDVTLNGNRVQDVALGMTAWDTDWR